MNVRPSTIVAPESVEEELVKLTVTESPGVNMKLSVLKVKLVLPTGDNLPEISVAITDMV